MQDMKIKLTEHSTLEVVAEALKNAGYEYVSKNAGYADATHLYAYCKGLVLKSGDGMPGYFEQHKNPEYLLVNGKFIAADEYYVYPETTYEPLPTEEPSAPTITPRVEFLRQRVSEILAAMTRFNDLKMVPPSEWHLELEDIFEEIKNA